MSDKYAALCQEISNSAIGSRDHLRKIALQLLDEIAEREAEREADKARIEELTHNHRVHAAKLISERGLLKQRIAELESRKVTVNLPPEVQSSNIPFAADGANAMRKEMIKALTEACAAAGITLETGERS